MAKIKKLLPQANDLSKVIKVFLFCTSKVDYTIEDVASFCSFEPRQSSYYISACRYLGLITEDGAISDLGREVCKDRMLTVRKIYEVVISDELISKIFAHMMIFPDDDISQFTFNIVRAEYPEYGDPVIKRRSSTLISWCNEVVEHIE